jgi:hypothetical protein
MKRQHKKSDDNRDTCLELDVLDLPCRMGGGEVIAKMKFR